MFTLAALRLNRSLYLGDCLSVMPNLPRKSVDLVLCDLPYGTTHADFDGVLKNMGKYRKRSIIPLETLWHEYRRLLTPSGVVVLFGAQPFTTALIQSNPEWYKYSWVWRKNRAANHVAVRYQPLKVHEDILVFSPCGCNTGASNPIPYYPQGVEWADVKRVRKTSVARSGIHRYNSLRAGSYTTKGTGYPNSILEFDVPQQDRLHPTQKPVDLCEYLIRTYTVAGATVLDNCMGSGTTGVAAYNTDRMFVGIEKDTTYFNLARNRLLEIRG